MKDGDVLDAQGLPVLLDDHNPIVVKDGVEVEVPDPQLLDQSAEEGAQISVIVSNRDFLEVAHFRMKRLTPLRKLMDAYCQKKNINRQDLLFSFNGTRIQGDEAAILLDAQGWPVFAKVQEEKKKKEKRENKKRSRPTQSWEQERGRSKPGWWSHSCWGA